MNRTIGTAFRAVEALFTAGWSLSEILFALRHPGQLLNDPHRVTLLNDIAKYGLYKHVAGPTPAAQLSKGGWIRLQNPYVRIGDGGPDHTVARMLRHRDRRKRRLLLMCHCYGLPFPRAMESLFGLNSLQGYDVVYHIMNHHHLGRRSPRFQHLPWPGFGLVSIQMSRFIENLRADIIGLRSLAQALVHSFGYESVAVLGYSIGGLLALHLGNCFPVSPVILYCPVADLEQTASQLGLMTLLKPAVVRTVRTFRQDFDLSDVRSLDPLNHRLLTHPSNLLVIGQRQDAMVSFSQLDRLIKAYPEAQWFDAPGTHVYPAERREIRKIMRDKLRSF